MKRGMKGLTVGEMLRNEEYTAHHNKHPKAKINIQQVAKARPALDVLYAEEGYFVDADILALEPTIIAELSGDKTYKEIYTSGKPHDAYLYTAIKIMPWVADEINAVYNIDSPTRESVKDTKKKFKSERTMAKPVFLSGQFGAGARKQWRMLQIMGYDIDFQTVKEMNKNFWGEPMFGDVVEWKEELLKEAEFNGGYVTNGFGRPYALLKHKQKDVINIQSQSGGHFILDLWSYYISTFVRERGVEAVPIVEDFHDEVVWWAPNKEQAEALGKVMEDALEAVNEEVGGDIPFKTDVVIAKRFTEFKEPDPWELSEVVEEDK